MKFLPVFAACLGMMVAASCAQTEKKQVTENQVIETIMARRSIRKYKPEAVSRETMAQILDCGINAPSGMNKQSWEVRVVDDPAVMDEIIAAMAAGNPDVAPEMVRG